MNEFYISKIFASDQRSMALAEQLLDSQGIRLDEHLDYTCGIYDNNDILVATGSCYGNTLRCLAVAEHLQGEGLLNHLVNHLIDYQFQRGIHHLFVYTKVKSAKFFANLGFHEIARVDETLVFLENKRYGLKKFIDNLKLEGPSLTGEKHLSAVILNANPFTLGHLHLIERAAKESDHVYIFIVSEDASLFPFDVRKKLIIEGTKHLTNLSYHDTGSYIISQSTFPSYFLKDEEEVIRTQATLDVEIFTMIAKSLAITHRFVGEEPFSLVTAIYNEIMGERLQRDGIHLHIIPRLARDTTVISASTVRQLIKENNFSVIASYVPEATYSFLLSPAAQPIIQRIQQETNVIHY